MIARELRHKLRIEEFAPLLDSSGHPVQDSETGAVRSDWQAIQNGHVWGVIAALSSREMLLAEQVNSEVRTRIMIRWRGDLNAAMRIVHVADGVDYKIYNIVGLIPDADTGRQWLTIDVKSGVNAG